MEGKHRSRGPEWRVKTRDKNNRSSRGSGAGDTQQDFWLTRSGMMGSCSQIGSIQLRPLALIHVVYKPKVGSGQKVKLIDQQCLAHVLYIVRNRTEWIIINRWEHHTNLWPAELTSGSFQSRRQTWGWWQAQSHWCRRGQRMWCSSICTCRCGTADAPRPDTGAPGRPSQRSASTELWNTNVLDWNVLLKMQ